MTSKAIHSLTRAFTAHPAKVNETYLEHAAVALGFAGQLFLAAGAALIHAALPIAFEKTASNKIRALHARMEHRN
ncbi:MAG: DUF6356 family protein [Pseudomonadota bacterium]